MRYRLCLGITACRGLCSLHFMGPLIDSGHRSLPGSLWCSSLADRVLSKSFPWYLVILIKFFFLKVKRKMLLTFQNFKACPEEFWYSRHHWRNPAFYGWEIKLIFCSTYLENRKIKITETIYFHPKGWPKFKRLTKWNTCESVNYLHILLCKNMNQNSFIRIGFQQYS